MSDEPLSILVAARDEAGRVGATVRRLRDAFPAATLIVADDGSRDGTAVYFVAADPANTTHHQFEVAGVQSTLAKLASNEDPITALFESVCTFAQSQQLADDATALLVRYA